VNGGIVKLNEQTGGFNKDLSRSEAHPDTESIGISIMFNLTLGNTTFSGSED
jgi:hypothetical protein